MGSSWRAVSEANAPNFHDSYEFPFRHFTFPHFRDLLITCLTLSHIRTQNFGDAGFIARSPVSFIYLCVDGHLTHFAFLPLMYFVRNEFTFHFMSHSHLI